MNSNAMRSRPCGNQGTQLSSRRSMPLGRPKRRRRSVPGKSFNEARRRRSGCIGACFPLQSSKTDRRTVRANRFPELTLGSGRLESTVCRNPNYRKCVSGRPHRQVGDLSMAVDRDVGVFSEIRGEECLPCRSRSHVVMVQSARSSMTSSRERPKSSSTTLNA